MKPSISDKAKQFRRSISPVRQIMDYADPEYIRSFGIRPEDLVSYAGGWVNHPAPEGLREAYNEICRDAALFHRCGAYSHPLGLPDFKNAICDFEKHVYGISDLSPSQIAVGLGSTQLAIGLFEALLNPGDKLLLLDPSYCNYPTQAISTILNVEILRFSVLDEKAWTYEADNRVEEFRKYILERKPKVVLLVSPDNPTSRMPSDRFVKAGLEAVMEVGGFMVMDYAYKELVFDAKHPEYFSWGPGEHFIAMRSSSKWCRSLGRRLGWVEAPTQVIQALESIQNSQILAPDMMHQMAMAMFIQESIKSNSLHPYLNETRARYKSAAVETLRAIESNLGFPALEPEGGLFTCMKVDQDGSRFVDEMLRNTGVLFVPGWGFGRTVKNAVRVSFGPLVMNVESINRGFAQVASYQREKPGSST